MNQKMTYPVHLAMLKRLKDERQISDYEYEVIKKKLNQKHTNHKELAI